MFGPSKLKLSSTASQSSVESGISRFEQGLSLLLTSGLKFLICQKDQKAGIITRKFRRLDFAAENARDPEPHRGLGCRSEIGLETAEVANPHCIQIPMLIALKTDAKDWPGECRCRKYGPQHRPIMHRTPFCLGLANSWSNPDARLVSKRQ
jgi:hypothetical protein